MSKFEAYSLDQFPLRDKFRQVKSVFSYYVMQQKDNNEIYVEDGYAAKLLYPMDEAKVDINLEILNKVVRQYLIRGKCNMYVAITPDKGYYLAEENGYLSMDYEKLFSKIEEKWPADKIPKVTYIDLTDVLTIDSYYRTDTHWRQEEILPAANKIAQAMGVTVQQEEEYTRELVERPFYGVDYGHAALPMDPEPLNWVTWEGWEDIRVQIMDTNTVTGLYNEEKLSSRDPYESYLSGNVAVEVITNPNAETNRERVVFRDSFGSSIAPWLARSYAKITLVDTRYVAPVMISQFVTFNPNTEVLFLYSTLVINSSSSLRQ
jgi:hypothetical protein